MGFNCPCFWRRTHEMAADQVPFFSSGSPLLVDLTKCCRTRNVFVVRRLATQENSGTFEVPTMLLGKSTTCHSTPEGGVAICRRIVFRVTQKVASTQHEMASALPETHTQHKRLFLLTSVLRVQLMANNFPLRVSPRLSAKTVSPGWSFWNGSGKI